MLVLRERFGMLPAEFDFLSKVRCGATLPYPVIKAMVKGLNTIYPAYNYKSRNRQRIENAYHDAIFFYKVTNHLNPDLIRLAYRKDRKEGFREKRLGLLHPRELPGGVRLPQPFAPVLVPSLRQCRRDERRASSTSTTRRSRAASPCWATSTSVLSGQAPVDGLAARLGDESLDTGRENCTPIHSKPLPLREIMDEMYRKMGAEADG